MSPCEMCFQYEQILKAAPSLLYAIDKDEKLLFANLRMLNLLGIDNISACNATLYKRMAQHTAWLEARIESLRDTDLEVMHAGTSQYAIIEPSITDKRGFIFYYEATRLPLKNLANEQIGLIVILTDITSIKTLDVQVKSETKDLHNKRESIRPYPPSVYRNTSKPPNFLIIEDNALVQQATKAILNQLDCDVDVAATNMEVDHLVTPGKYDVVLMDIGLEGTSGYLMAKRIRHIEENSGYRVPIIALTGFEADLVKTDCDYYFMEGAITKPLSKEQAKQIIQRYLYNIPVNIHGLKSLINV